MGGEGAKCGPWRDTELKKAPQKEKRIKRKEISRQGSINLHIVLYQLLPYLIYTVLSGYTKSYITKGSSLLTNEIILRENQVEGKRLNRDSLSAFCSLLLLTLVNVFPLCRRGLSKEGGARGRCS